MNCDGQPCGNGQRRNIKARLSDDAHPEPQPEPSMPEPLDGPVDAAWTIPTEDGVIVVPEKVAAWDAANTAAHPRRGGCHDQS
jgi:hypothetical protein